MRTITSLFLCTTLILSHAQNKPEREAWLQDAGFGMFIHWSLDVQLGIVISHSLVGADAAYRDRYFHQLPQTFNPKDFDPERMAVLAKLAGMKYMVFTTKHHSGFCMWDTETSDFNIMRTPYGQDVVQQYVDACRKHGLAVGFYYSPEDFWFLAENNQLIRRRNIDQIPEAFKQQYIAFTKAQCTELLTKYGKIDLMFFDGGDNLLIDHLKPHCWALNPDLLVTRGEISTPEQYLPGISSERVWEACMTMGTQWQFKPTHEQYKPAIQVIKMLVETRAKGGALLLNIGPDEYGNIPFEQSRNLQEVAAWYFVNQEAVDGVRPWVLTHERDVWYTASPDGQTVYAVLFNQPPWPRGERREITLAAVAATPDTRVSVLSQSDSVVEYMPEVDATTRFRQTGDGLEVSLVRAQRLYNNHQWPNPLVLKLQNVRPALQPPAVQTLDGEATGPGSMRLHGHLRDLGDAEALAVSYAYRPMPTALNARTLETGWNATGTQTLTAPGTFSFTVEGLAPGLYEVRAVVQHPKLPLLGDVRQVRVE